MNATRLFWNHWRARLMPVLMRWFKPLLARPTLLVGVLFGLYVLLFVPIFLALGDVVGAFGILLAMIAGFLLRPSKWVVFSVVLAAANGWLYGMFEPFHLSESLGEFVVVLFMCAMGGYARSAWDRLKRQQVDLDAAHQRLKDTQALLVQSAKLASIGELAAGVGHEINQPLQVISLCAETALESAPGALPQEVRDALDLIVAQTRRASAIIAHLKAIGRKTDPAQKVPGDLNAIIEQSLLLFSNRLRESSIALDLQLGQGLPPALCNAVMIEQVLMNLYINSTDALEKRPERRIAIRTLRDGDFVCIEVADTGSGIAPDIMDKIFDPFFTTKPVGRGTGLGLSISYRILADHGGYIRACSQVGVGTTFRIGLPAASVSAQAAA